VALPRTLYTEYVEILDSGHQTGLAVSCRPAEGKSVVVLFLVFSSRRRPPFLLPLPLLRHPFRSHLAREDHTLPVLHQGIHLDRSHLVEEDLLGRRSLLLGHNRHEADSPLCLVLIRSYLCLGGAYDPSDCVRAVLESACRPLLKVVRMLVRMGVGSRTHLEDLHIGRDSSISEARTDRFHYRVGRPWYYSEHCSDYSAG
jgi:hypothetical protein